MRKFLLSLAILSATLFFVPLAAGQTPTLVSGTITDINGIPYSNAKVSASLVGIPPNVNATIIVNGIPTGIGGQQNAGADVNGNFTMNLFCNSAGGGCSVISPGGTTWLITVNETGVNPPEGRGPQVCTATVTITGSSQNISSSLSSCPALLLATVASGGGGGPGYVLAASFGVDGSANFVCDATFVNTTAVVTTPTTDPPFKASNVGQIDWGSAVSCGGNSNGIPLTLIAQGTILTFTSAHSITVSTTASGNCSPTLADNCPFVWGPDHTAQLQAAWTALAATGYPGTLVLPAGGIIIQAPPAATSNLIAPGSGSPVAGYTVQGQGQYSTVILTSPSMTWPNPMFQMTATNGVGVFGQRMTNFEIASFVRAAAAENGKSGFFMNTIYSEYDHLSVQQWYPSDGTFTFVAINTQSCGGCEQDVHDIVMVGAGTTSIVINNADHVFVSNVVIQSASCTAINVNPAGTIVLTNIHAVHNGNGCGNNGGGLWVNTTAGTVVVTNSLLDAGAFPTNAGDGCTISSTGTLILINSQCGTTAASAGAVGLRVGAGAKVFVDGDSSTMYSTANGQFGINNSGTLTLRGTTATNAGTSVSMTNSGTVLFKEANSFPQGITNTGTFQVQEGVGGHIGGCTGTVATGNNGLNLNSIACAAAVGGVIMGKSGTVYAVYCTAGTGGNQAADACTLFKNGGATALTASLNGVATATDGAVAHVVSYVATDRLQVVAVGGAGTTLANVQGGFVTQ